MLSAVVHTYNEESNIELCLRSLDFVDEIVIVDMGSTDRTCKIAEKFKTKIYNHPYTGFVEPARNFGISKTTGDWIIIIDSDEEIPTSLSSFLLKEIKNTKGNYFRIPRKNIIFGKWMKHTGWWPDYQIRLFKRGCVTWTEKIHGVPITKGEGVDIPSDEILNIIHHHYQSVEQYITRLNRYTSISAKESYLANNKFYKKDLFEVPVKEFVNRYFVWEGYKDGVHGLALSLLQSISELITVLKIWELDGFKKDRITFTELQNHFDFEYRTKRYWIIEELLKLPQNFLSRIILKLKRKF